MSISLKKATVDYRKKLLKVDLSDTLSSLNKGKYVVPFLK